MENTPEFESAHECWEMSWTGVCIRLIAAWPLRTDPRLPNRYRKQAVGTWHSCVRAVFAQRLTERRETEQMFRRFFLPNR